MVAKKFSLESETQVEIEFSNPKKIQAIFIDGDWKDMFFELDSLGEFSQFVAQALVRCPEHFNVDVEARVIEIEGVGTFVHQGCDLWLAVNTAFGEIRVQFLYRDEFDEGFEIKDELKEVEDGND